jgi:orotidine-5'-phosphate decarboxylase
LFEKLSAAARVNRSWLMVGLDPVLDKLPDGMRRDPSGALEFNRAIIAATSDLVIGYKPNFAFYEAMGPEGWHVLKKTRAAIPPDLFALGDAKRGDIGDTAEMYARAIFDVLGFDAATVSPYVGREGVQPFLDRRDRGSFVVCRTSNRENTFQDMDAGGEFLYERVAQAVVEWGDNVGLVVGATDVDALSRVRRIAPAVPILVPGVGAQGGGLGAAVRAAVDAEGGNALISATRSVTYASSGHDFADAARAVASGLRDEIRSAAAGAVDRVGSAVPHDG